MGSLATNILIYVSLKQWFSYWYPWMLRKPQCPLVWSTSGQWISRRDILVEGLIPLSPNFQITQFSLQFKLRIKAHNVRSILRLLKSRNDWRKVGLGGPRLEDHKTWVCWHLISVLHIIYLTCTILVEVSFRKCYCGFELIRTFLDAPLFYTQMHGI